MFKLLRWTMTILGAAYLPAVFLVPALSPFRPDFFGWILFAVYVLVVAFLWHLDSRRNRDVSRGFDPDRENPELEETRDRLLHASFWSSLFRR